MKSIKSTRLYAWTLGVYEFRRIMTTSMNGTQESYDRGRMFAHKATCRIFDFGVDKKWR